MATNRSTQLGMHGMGNQPQHHGPIRQLAATLGVQQLDTISIKLPQATSSAEQSACSYYNIPKQKPHPQVSARKPIETLPSNLYGMLHPYNRPLSHPTGQLGEMPSPSSLPQSLSLFSTSQASNISQFIHSANHTQLLSNLTETYGASSKFPVVTTPQFVVGHSHQSPKSLLTTFLRESLWT